VVLRHLQPRRRRLSLSAADRFRAAARDRDPARAAREFADDIRLNNPMSAEPLAGRDAVAAALAGLDEVFDDFEHVQVLTDPDPGDAIAETQAVVFRARIGDHTVEGIDLLEVDHHDRIATFTVFARPLSALQARPEVRNGLGAAVLVAPTTVVSLRPSLLDEAMSGIKMVSETVSLAERLRRAGTRVQSDVIGT